MPTFFHGWRRKTGAATLLLACVFMAAWVRSYDYDWIMLFGTRIVSSDGYFGPSRIVITRDGALIIPVHRIFMPIPYWSIVLPLTMLSAYLLLSKRRPKPNQTDDTKSGRKLFDTP